MRKEFQTRTRDENEGRIK